MIARALEYLNTRTVDARLEIEPFDTRGGGPGRPPAEVSAVNRYQRDLEDEYDAWADDACKQLANTTDPDKRGPLLALLLGALLLSLQDLAHDELPNAIAMGLGGVPGDPSVYSKIAEVMAENDDYLKNSLMPDIEMRMLNALADPAIKAAIAAGNTSAARDALRGQAELMKARVAQYSGTWWALMNYAVGAQAAKLGQRIRWTRDEQAKHCPTCLQYGEREYDSFEAMMDITGGISPADGTDCGSNCRCVLEIID